MPSRYISRRGPYIPRGGGAIRGAIRGAAYAWRNRKAVQQAGRYVGKSIRSYFKGTGSSSTTTANRDIRTSRAPRKKRVNKRFTRKVENVISQHAGKNTVVFNGAAVATSASAGTQNFRFFTLFGSNGGVGMDQDLNKMLTFHEDATDIEDPESKNLFYNYGVLEVGFTNRNTTDRCIVEIYEWKVRKNIKIYVSPGALLTSNIADEDILTDPVGPVNQINMTSVGTTPYQIPDLCSNLRFGKKTTIQLAPGGTSSYVLARKKNRWIKGLKVRDSISFSFDGWTEGLFFVVKGAPASGTTAAATNVDFMQNRKYCWRAMDPDAKNEYMQQAW